MIYDIIRKRMEEIVPLNKLLGVKILSIGDGVAEACVVFRPEIANHFGTAHATVIFAAAEAASGAAMLGALAPMIATIRAVASEARISFVKAAKSNLIARAKPREAAESLRARLSASSKIVFEVDVGISDQTGDEIARAVVSWNVSKKLVKPTS